MKHILVVDDEIILREYLTELLELEGFNSSGAGNLHEALAAYQKQKPDLVICDMNLVNESGLQVIAALKIADQAFTAAVLFISADLTPAMRKQAELAGAGDFISKPYDNAVLLKTIRKHLNLTR